MEISIRPENISDHELIYDLTKRAFANMPFAGGDEQDLVNALRAANALSISLVAEVEGRLAGHIAFSPAYAADGTKGYYALGPVSVEPDLQKQAIGSALIRYGIGLLRDRGAAACILTGNPAFYRRFGFEGTPQSAPENVPKEYFMILPLGKSGNHGVIDFHPLFDS